MFRINRSSPHPWPSGLSMPVLLRRVSTPIFLAALLTLTLAACGGDSGGATEQSSSEEGAAGTSAASTPAEDTPTPEARTQAGAELTTEEYAAAQEEAFQSLDDETEDAAEDMLRGTPFTSSELERIASLETAESWSDEDAAFMSEYAETTLEIVTSFYDVALGAFRDTIDEISGLRPPGHLSDLHDNIVVSFGEFIRFTQEQVDIVKDTSTDIRDLEDLADFEAVVNSLESGPLDPEVSQQAEDIMRQGEEACQALEDKLEAELERDVSVC